MPANTLHPTLCLLMFCFQEMLLELVTERAGSGMLRGGRSELTYDDVAAVVAEWKALDFLQDIVPSRMPVALALQRMLQTRAQAAPGGT